MLVRDLEWIVALADHEHLTETAAVLRVSQPTLSRALARVEEELGVRLFERVPHGLVTTPDGELVVTTARDLLTRYQQLRHELEARHDPDRGTVRLAFLDSMATSLVPQVLRGFHEQAPLVRVELTQEPSHDMMRDLATGAAELAIMSARPTGDFAWAPLQEERLVAVVSPGHRLRERKQVDLAELADDDLVTTPPGFGHSSLVDGLLSDAGAAPAVSFESADLATIEGLVAAGLGFAIVPEHIAGVSGTIALRIRNPRARRTIGLTWRTDRPLAPVAARLRDHVVAHAPYGRPGVGAAT
ncbi:LysR family transcriptional regulator [Nocardioides daeguensis]|uniref:LysR family transcriptional regulator n=1 Tax=Nocardioides daeguensis TaxID=908359 RepID=A0ABP6V025_9ACTN|nr:LysR family transcriptional regulator [Nocardioides daeguensis]MBV6727212.1 LysR family transcriptional regulator [Nocardioides daeguensis]MCR1771226.1 LysR family transcriptional regulator [Nocardioides daeguensis]